MHFTADFLRKKRGTKQKSLLSEDPFDILSIDASLGVYTLPMVEKIDIEIRHKCVLYTAIYGYSEYPELRTPRDKPKQAPCSYLQR